VGQSGEPDEWALTVVAVADHRCRQHTPSQVLLNRLGARGWGGIGLAAALALTLAALSSAPGELRAGIARGGAATTGPRERMPDPSERFAGGTRPPTAYTPTPSPGEDRRFDPSDPGVARRRTNGGDESGNASAAANSRSNSASENGRGGGAGKAPDRGARQPAAEPDAPLPGSNPRERGDGVKGSGGGSTSRPSSETDASPGSAASGAADSAQRPPAWQSPSWPTDAQRAQDAIDAGRVPDAYRDLVRDYFDRP
jgi:hypothetical protein